MDNDEKGKIGRLAHLETLKELHQLNLDQGYSRVFLINALEKKYRNAPKEFIWQWLFPAKQLIALSEKRSKKSSRFLYPFFFKKTHCQHYQSHVMMPAEPRPDLVMIHSQIAFSTLKTFFNGVPTTPILEQTAQGSLAGPIRQSRFQYLRY